MLIFVQIIKRLIRGKNHLHAIYIKKKKKNFVKAFKQLKSQTNDFQLRIQLIYRARIEIKKKETSLKVLLQIDLIKAKFNDVYFFFHLIFIVSITDTNVTNQFCEAHFVRNSSNASIKQNGYIIIHRRAYYDHHCKLTKKLYNSSDHPLTKYI